MRKITRMSIDALKQTMPVLTAEEERQIVGGYKVIIDVVRSSGGADSTLSTFTVTVYEDDGITAASGISGYSGFMLEPRLDPSLAQTEGSDTAISSGTYDLFWRADRNRFQLEDVPGRSGIQIHAGNSGNETTGCLLPGTGYSEHDSGSGNTDYSVTGSTTALSGITNILNAYGMGSGNSMAIRIQ
jgi:hypothetical protein